ncbi:MAG TPA: hypothetical protein DIU39_05700 [Flavobacteriales bacterium]|nr:hypothetical protein [Flavobacteriales bacterium]|tara:strand:+ start:56042 stop:56533 length:492 start_codon:yes stop_codon:yes gene_type:complete
MSKVQKIQMTFTCSQEWEEMKEVDCGKYCEQCNKVVHDFTHSTIEEILAKKRENPDICGSFLPEQVEPDLIPLKLPKQWFTAAAVLGFLFAGKNINAQNTQDSVKTEQHIPSQTTPASSLNEIKNENKLPECRLKFLKINPLNRIIDVEEYIFPKDSLLSISN